MKYKMIALDLDGTLKSSDATGRIILPKTKKILIELAKKGIVIEDVSASGDVNVQGSQFVWIPVEKFKRDDKTEVEITLGRYTFSSSTGNLPKILR